MAFGDAPVTALGSHVPSGGPGDTSAALAAGFYDAERECTLKHRKGFVAGLSENNFG